MTLSMLLTVVALAELAVIAYLAWLLATLQTKWMRLFSQHSLGINPIIMENDAADEKAPVVKVDTRRRISVPLPGNSLFRKMGGQ